MKAYDLQPTEENLIETLKNDAIGRNESLFDFVNILNSLEGCFSIGIDGAWGSGKTFFVKQTKLILEALNPNSNLDDKIREKIKFCLKNDIHNDLLDRNDLINQVSVYYDAWFNDNETDPLLSLLASIVNEFDTIEDFKKYSVDKGKLAESIASLFRLKLNNPFECEDLLKKEKENKEFYDEVVKTFDSILEERGDRLVIFIDELDRCSPQFAVKLLERVKHYFNNDRITFVFSINTEQLQYTIKNFYGEGFNASRYLDRFFDMRISIPAYNADKFFSLCNFKNDDFYSLINIQIIKVLDLQMREISKFLKINKIATRKIFENNSFSPFNKIIEFTSHTIVPIIIAMKISGSPKYNDFVNGKDCSILLEVFKNIKYSNFILQPLLSEKEYFKDNMQPDCDDAIEVLIDDKLNDYYNAIFNFEKTAVKDTNIVLGEFVFHKELSQYILNVANLLSKDCNI